MHPLAEAPRKQRGIGRTRGADGQRAHGDTGRHLHDGKQGVQTLEHAARHGHTENRQVGLGGPRRRRR